MRLFVTLLVVQGIVVVLQQDLAALALRVLSTHLNPVNLQSFEFLFRRFYVWFISPERLRRPLL